MENNKSNLVLGALLGAAAGFVLGYLLSGKKMNQMGGDLAETASKIKDKFNETVDKGKEVVSDLKNGMNENSSGSANI